MKKGLFYAILASVLWAIVNPFIKQGLSYDFSPMNFAGIRFTTVGIILFAYTWHKGMWKEIRQHSKLFLNLILINMFMGYTAFYFGVDFVSGAISSIIMGMTPLINVLLAHLLASNDRLNVHKIISLIVSLIGLLLIVGMGSNGAPLDWKGITGIVLLLLSIIFQGYSAISVSEDKGKINPIFLNAVQMFFGGLLIYGVGIAAEDIGLAYPQAITVTKSCVDAALQLGLPEARLPLAEAAVLLATAPKSNSAHNAIIAAMEDIQRGAVGDIPRHLKNVHADSTGADKAPVYKYPHNYPGHYVQQRYLPESLGDTHYYAYGENKTEQAARRYWDDIKRKNGNGPAVT